jgi:two-component system chemotaxis sensor kinase CheA
VHEFLRIDGIQGNVKLSNKILTEVYQSIHSIKSNAVTIGLKNFGTKMHELESEIKRLRDQEAEVEFDDMLSLAIRIEKLALEKDNFKLILARIDSFRKGGGARRSGLELLLETFSKTTETAAYDLGKRVSFMATHLDGPAFEGEHSKTLKDVLVQLIRNSVVHGIELPEDRIEIGKNETGTIKLSVKREDGKIIVQLGDDGRGIDFKKIRAKALSLNLITKAESNSKAALLKAMFSPGFSTADEAGMHAGRGVGLDIVQERLKEINGTVKIQTDFGKGTVFIITIPAK